jgi:hypothetical protein
MAKGGRRQGAGRPRGAKDGSSTARAARLELTKQIAERAAAEGVMPLEVMITAMRQAWAEADRDKAVSYAEKAAPYLHAKLANVQHSGDAENPVAMAIMSGVPDVADADDDHQRQAPSSH